MVNNSIKDLEPGFIRLIHERFGLVLRANQTGALNKTILAACLEHHCEPQEYFQKLKKCPGNSPLLAHLIAGITVGETYFFRDERQIHLLKTILLPRLIKRKMEEGDLNLRIWSAGCSTGEEIYTIAILLSEMIEDLKSWNLQLLGTDINRKALKSGEAGVFNKKSLRSTNDHYRKRYFLKINNHYELSQAILKLVRFDYINLMDTAYPSILNGTNDQDLILCRNVLIYFDDEIISQIIKKLCACLSNRGYFLFGASDPIMITENNLDFHHEEEAIYFSLSKSLSSNSAGDLYG